LLATNNHDAACEVASNAMKWHAVQQRVGLTKTQALVQRCCGVVEYLALQAGTDTFKFRVLRNAHNDLRAILEVLQLNLGEGQHVGVVEGFVLWQWLSAKPDASKANLIATALRRIAALQDRVLAIFKNSAGILKSSAPGCVWRLLQRANAAEWLSHVCMPSVFCSFVELPCNCIFLRSSCWVLSPAAILRSTACFCKFAKKLFCCRLLNPLINFCFTCNCRSLTLRQACAFVRQPAAPAAIKSPPRHDAALPEVSNND
jgi:hypothetical protein